MTTEADEELSTIAMPFCIPGGGNCERARQVWQAWRDAFAGSDDPRHMSMTATFARELAELQSC